MRDLIDSHLGGSLMAEQAADAVNWDWWQEFTSQASGLGTTLTPSVIGFAASLDNLSSLLDGQAEILPIALALAVYMLAWLFLSGAIVDRYARQRPTRVHGFFAAAGVFFWRFLRLGVIVGVMYWFLFTYVHDWLLTDFYSRFTLDLAVERQAFMWRLGLYTLFGALLVMANVIVDYAKIRTVVEDRRSAIGALLAALAFIRRRPGRVIGLYALNALTFVTLLAVWAVAAPGASGGGGAIWLGLVVGQIYVLGRLLLKLQFIASQTALFQASLAHATCAASPITVWPESPAAESIRSA